MEENIKEKSANKQQRSFFCRKIQIPIFGVLIIVVLISLQTYALISVNSLNSRVKTLEEKKPKESVSTTSQEMTAERTKRSTGPTKMEIILKKLNKMEERCNQSYHSVARQPVFVLRSLPGKPGRDGVPGRDGAQGQRVPGLAGKPGQDGIPGKDGAQGQGVPGLPGQDGIPGKDGAQGEGVPGLPGGDGVPGRDGAQGQGVPGLAGKPGQDGVPGKDGAQGQGMPGLPGGDGVPGKDGAQGQGVPGLAGKPGQDGIPGRDGAQGQGVPGLPGKSGQDGVPGRDGAQGQGVPGTKGQDGRDGAKGPKGDQGTSGQQGAQGISGQKGEQGNRGVSGVSYVRWGKKTCPTTGAKLVYEGYVGGSRYTQRGGGSNYVCLSRNPTYEKYQDGVQSARSNIYGAEYESFSIGIFPSSLQDHEVPCVRCHVNTRATQMMIPGRNVCPAGWTREYKGYLMAERHDFHRTMFTCVDENPDYVPGTRADLDGVLFYFAEGRCGSLPCKPYVDGRELTCAVCTR